MKKIICLYGGPGTGKSTTCAGVFYKLKLMGFNAEMNREYVKNWVWEKRDIKPGDQTYIFAKQSRFERVYMDAGMDFIITDSPLILTHFYGLKYDELEQKYNTSLMMLENHHGICKDKGYKVDHFFLERTKVYNPSGRLQTEEEAKKIDTEILDLLHQFDIKYKTIEANEKAADNVVASVLPSLRIF